MAVNIATAHPHVDPDGTVYNMGNSYMGSSGPTYNIIKFPPKKTLPDGKLLASYWNIYLFNVLHIIHNSCVLASTGTELTSFDQASVVATIPCQWKLRPCYYHSFCITDNYFVHLEQPLGISLPKLVSYQVRGKAFMKAMDWLPHEKVSYSDTKTHVSFS